MSSVRWEKSDASLPMATGAGPNECVGSWGRLDGILRIVLVAYVDFISDLHQSTPRDYLKRVLEHPKAECAEVAIQFGKDYWDGERQYGYGGYKYDGRWRAVAKKMVDYYGLKPESKVLDVGCGKGFLLFEFTQVLPGIQVAGI